MLITLTTDFGVVDHFVGTMKGVILEIAPRTRIVDITHEIAAYEVDQAAFVIAQAWRYFPQGTVHVVVIDPGVGSERRPILVEAGGQYFIGPDNGVFSAIYDAGPHKVRVISNPKLMLPSVSRTFHGRDIFAPAAAHLTRKVLPARFGKVIHDAIRFPLPQPAQIAPHAWSGVILKTDRFGNLVTNFSIETFSDIKTRPMELRVGLERIQHLALNYTDTQIGELMAIVGSSGYLEVAAHLDSAAKRLGCGVGAPVELEIFFP